MAKTGTAVKKLAEKAKRNALKHKHGPYARFAVEVTQPPKTMAERAKADKRPSLRREWRHNFRPRVNTWRPSDEVKSTLANILRR